MASSGAKKEVEKFLILDEKLKLFDIEETLELRKDTSCLIMIGVSSQRLGKAFCAYLSSITDKSKLLDKKNLTPLTDIVETHRQEQYDGFYILDFSAEQYADKELSELVSNLNFYRDYIGELGLKIIVVASSEVMQYIYSNAYDFVSFNNFMAYFDDVKIDIDIKVDLSKLEEAQKDYKEYIRQPQISAEIKMQKLYELANTALWMSVHDVAIKYFQELLKFSQKKKNFFFEAASHGGIAICLRHFDLYDSAIFHIKSAIKVFAKIKQRQNEAYATYELGRIYYRQSKYDKAMECFEGAMTMAKAHSVTDFLPEILGNIGHVHAAQDAPDYAMQYYQRAIALSKKIGAAENISFVYDGIGSVYAEKYNYQQALGFYQQALEFAKQNADYEAQMVYIGNMGIAYRFLGEPTKSIVYFKQALYVLESLHAASKVMLVLVNLSEAFIMLGDLKMAKEYCEKSNLLRNKTTRAEDEASVLNCFGEIAVAEEEYEKALVFYEKASRLSQSVNNRKMTLAILCDMCSVYIKLKNYEKAKKLLSGVIQKSDELSIFLTKAYALKSYGALYMHEEQSIEAVDSYIASINIFNELGYLYGKCEVLFELGDLYNKVKEAAKAKMYYADALEIAQAGSFGLLLEKIKKAMSELGA